MKPPAGLSTLASNPWLRAAVALLGVVLLSVLVWVFGPVLGFGGIAPLASDIARFAVIGVLVLLWAVFTFLSFRARRNAEKALIEGASAGQADPSAVAAAEEVAALKGKLTEALTLLAKARGGRALYELPWYVIIGPPGSGKTTALMNAGLTFPLAERMGTAPIAGIGGTRLCDWWFTDDAVFIDTAGRYTTQDSDAAVDKAGWRGFLDLLRKNRPRAPLNGALVAISLADLATHSREERLAHARAVRARLKELDETLGVRLPVYVLFTKADLVAGFTEYFDDLDREAREQVWGVTLPAGVKGPAGFAEAFRALLDRVTARIPERVQAERSPDRRASLFGFPAQLASMEGPAAEFLDTAFRDSNLDAAPYLRGLYITSGTQEGTPIDRLTGAMARLFNVPRARLAAAQPGQGRSYFLARLLREVVFGESGLVSAKPGAATRRRALTIGAWSIAALAVLGMGGAWFSAWRANEAEVGRLEAAVRQLETTARALPLDPVAEANLPAVLPLLDQARALPYGRDNRARGSGLGLSQAPKLAAAADSVYRRELDRVLLPRLLWRLESQMRGALQQPEFLYEATRVYLMLGGQGPLDRALVRDWMALDWAQAFNQPQQTAMRTSLAGHLDALLEGPMPAYGLDGLLIDEARRVFSRLPLAGRAYSRLRPVAAAANLAPWTPGEAAGPAGTRAFTRPSGRPLSEGVPGLYTREAFHRVVLPNLEAVSREVAQESWVLGPGNEVRLDDAALVRLQQDVLNLYYDDYARMWDGLLADLAIAPFRGMGQAVDTLNILSAPQSPMRDLLAGITRQLTLSVPPEGLAAPAAAGAAPAPPTPSARLQGIFGAAQPGAPPPPPPGSAIDERYSRLRQFVGAGPGAPIDNTLKLLSDLYQQLARMAANPGQPITPGVGLDPVQALQGEASRVPPPVDGWIRAVSQGGTAVRAGGAQAALAGAFQAGVAPLCSAAIANRFPFVRGATAETPMDDFARLFAPGGLIDGFFNTNLRPFVDTTQRTWRLQAVEGVTPRVDVANFQRASVIRDVFFSGGAQPTVRFEIQPVAMDPAAQSALLDLDGVQITYSHGPSRPTLVTWPGTNRMNNVRLVFSPPPSGGEGAINASGPWALFRLFARAQVAPGRVPEEFTLTFSLGERQVSYVVRAGSVFNPFSLRELAEFRCPTLQP
ncbi:type VI secretion system membrane subunit TssM [Elioraea sp.]|uniref:type VI secretion system membrane subunit TssM n=1 Tax=Elioraea sp. TaxID=2185103 RepID=UPI0025BF3BD3|nr:type VI secretion system membrane subunit TssM [Elioraea sp.]